MANQEMNEKILNKKFKKGIFSGYDTADVDAFFDHVIEYLKNNDKMVELYKDDIAKLKEQIKQLQEANEQLKQQTTKLANEVKSLEEEGYGKSWLKSHNTKR